MNFVGALRRFHNLNVLVTVTITGCTDKYYRHNIKPNKTLLEESMDRI